MVALIKLVPGIAAFLFFSATSATPVERTDVQELSNSTFIAENDRPFSVQILLLRNTGTEFWWQMYQGPALVAVQPCRYIEPFKFAHFKGPYNYNPNAINNPPNAPAMELKLLEFLGHKDCVWKNDGHGNAGHVICGGNNYYKHITCEKDSSYDDGVIKCENQWYHRMFSCRF